jgi:drug/metabolite transporter (DMT)-like permease
VKPLHLILLIVMNCLWGTTYSMFKALAPSLNPGGVATLRFGLAAAALALCWPLLPGRAPRGWDLARTMAMGIVVFVWAPRLQVAGVQMGQASDASVLMAMEPLITSVGAAIFLREMMAARRWFGLLLGLLGTLVMAEIWRPGFHWPDLLANALIVLSFFCESAYSLMGKPMLERAGIFKVLAIALISATAVNLLADRGATLTLPPKAWLVLAYLALICTLAGYSLWFAVIKEAEVNVVALTVFVQPLAGVAVARFWLRETLHWGQLWGSLLIVAGLIVGLPRPPRRV